MKYPRMDWQTMENIVDRLGGMEGVQEFLSGATRVVPTDGVHLTHAESKEYFGSHKKLVAIRNLLNGKGNYEDRVNLSLGVVTREVSAFVHDLVLPWVIYAQKKPEIDEGSRKYISERLSHIRRLLAEFEKQEGFGLPLEGLELIEINLVQKFRPEGLHYILVGAAQLRASINSINFMIIRLLQK